MKRDTLFKPLNFVTEQLNDLEIIKYIYFKYEILMFRYMNTEVDTYFATRCAKDLYGIDLLTESMKKEFINNHSNLILDYKYKKHVEIIKKLSNYYINNIIVSERYKKTPLSKAVYGNLKQLILNRENGLASIKNVIASEDSLYTKDSNKKVISIDSMDIESIELELEYEIGNHAHLENKENMTYLTETDKLFLIEYNKFIEEYLYIDGLATVNDFDKIRLASVIMNILYYLYYPINMKIRLLHILYDIYIKNHKSYSSVLDKARNMSEEIINIQLPSHYPEGFSEQFLITKCILLINNVDY